MSYIDFILQPEERVLSIGKMHWITYLRGLVALVVGIVLLFANVDANGLALFIRLAGWVMIGLGLVAIGRSWLEQFTTEIAVTNRRVIQKRGLVWRKTGEMNMGKVESVQVDQSILGRILDYGTIAVHGTGSGIEGLHHIARPLQVRSAIVVR
ncbi:PH domain-containing protein [Devosia sp. Root436]|uniref:PH domain-containing protein n=1 Tax=Devosia sp. Root436 TaxID=1736537 RepID=UPI0012E3B505|nr:PH domain-containing protein [Devosia sp. Root436]